MRSCSVLGCVYMPPLPSAVHPLYPCLLVQIPLRYFVCYCKWSTIHARPRCTQLLLIENWRVNERAVEILLQSSCGWVVQCYNRRRSTRDAGMFESRPNQFRASNDKQIIRSMTFVKVLLTGVGKFKCTFPLKTLLSYLECFLFINIVYCSWNN